ncbi:hypothetical protein PR048_012913 [Dryococelus australis]|uniref:CCHC-type domain-containing protein n=1 Tax=Dryococelus australis TaxID=614101 RepID=A0ABQ9HRJ3_9NEOP|nr:hypothetical protein PR048_012913 [Dryococelus australis]
MLEVVVMIIHDGSCDVIQDGFYSTIRRHQLLCQDVTFYDGQPKTCGYCDEAGHLGAECPKEKLQQLRPCREWGTLSSQQAGTKLWKAVSATLPDAASSINSYFHPDMETLTTSLLPPSVSQKPQTEETDDGDMCQSMENLFSSGDPGLSSRADDFPPVILAMPHQVVSSPHIDATTFQGASLECESQSLLKTPVEGQQTNSTPNLQVWVALAEVTSTLVECVKDIHEVKASVSGPSCLRANQLLSLGIDKNQVRLQISCNIGFSERRNTCGTKQRARFLEALLLPLHSPLLETAVGLCGVCDVTRKTPSILQKHHAFLISLESRTKLRVVGSAVASPVYTVRVLVAIDTGGEFYDRLNDYDELATRGWGLIALEPAGHHIVWSPSAILEVTSSTTSPIHSTRICKPDTMQTRYLHRRSTKYENHQTLDLEKNSSMGISTTMKSKVKMGLGDKSKRKAQSKQKAQVKRNVVTKGRKTLKAKKTSSGLCFTLLSPALGALRGLIRASSSIARVVNTAFNEQKQFSKQMQIWKLSPLVKKKGQGVFMRDDLPPKPKRHECAIIILDTTAGCHMHWVSYVKKAKYADNYDSFGNSGPPPELCKDLKYTKLTNN